MYTLRLLGEIGLSDDEGREVEALLRQTKHIALLAYLALPRPGTWHRRDSLVGTFWPEREPERSRSVLRSAVYTLRRHLPEGAIVSRGDDELGLSPEIIQTDVTAMCDDFAAGRFAEALGRYQGELLTGIFIAEAEEFEKWVERERNRARSIAQKAATELSLALEKKGDLMPAIEAARRATELDPNDEAAARRQIALLDRGGDRAQAFAVYERFRNHMSDSFGVRPSAETVALLDTVRTRRVPSTQAVSADTQPPIEKLVPHQSAGGFPSHDEPRGSRNRWWLVAAPIAIAVFTWVALHLPRDATATSISRSLVVLPIENQTGDARLAHVATDIAGDAAQRLDGIGGIRIRRGARSDWPAATHRDIQPIWRELGSTVLLRSILRKAGDSLELDASVVDAGTFEERTVAAHKFSIAGIREEESRFAADVAGAVFRTAMPVLPRISRRPADPESYRLMLEGWHELLSNIQASPAFGTGRPGLVETPATRAIDLFTKAVNIDPLNARAWAGISSAWASQAFSGSAAFGESYDRASAAAMHALALDSLQGSAWANLAVMRALKYRNLAAGAGLIQKAETAEPSNPEVFLIKANMFREAHLYDQARDAIRVARQLDPITPFYIQWEANLEFCADRPEIALQLNETETELNPSNQVARIGVTRALAMLGRYDEAIASWRKEALALGDTSLATALVTVHGKSGYWSQKHADGRMRLESLRRRTNGVLLLALMQAQFSAGDADAGFKTLDAAAATDTRALYRLRCMRDLDEFRHTPRFEAALAKIGALRIR